MVRFGSKGPVENTSLYNLTSNTSVTIILEIEAE